MEGVSGVVNLAQVTPGAPEYAEARGWFMAELLALIEGLREGGATEVSVYDEHWFGRNVDLAKIPAGVRVFMGKPPYRTDWAGGLDATTTGVILHGLHSMDGTGETLAHTYEPDFKSIRLNGVAVGEIGVEAAVAGDWGVPLVLVIADSAGAAEAAKLVPGVATVATKISRAPTGAECFALVDNLAAIHRAAAQIARTLPDVAPFQPGKPAEMVCGFKPGRYLEGLRAIAGERFAGPDSIRLTGPTFTSVWAEYWQLKLRVQAALA